MVAFLQCFLMTHKMNMRAVIDGDADGEHDAGSHRVTVTADEFKEWLRRFDVDGDGRISRDELRRAMRALRVRFTGHRARRGISYADADGDGYIDDSEIDRLVEFARRNLGLRIVAS